MGKGWDRNDYCDIIPDTLFGVKLAKCCLEHDIYYWKKPITRKEADKRLKKCMQLRFRKANKIFISIVIPNIIYFVLRIGGWIKWVDWKKFFNSFKKVVSL